jgi:hypothetical protein
MTTIISLLLLSTAGVAYAIHELHAHGKLKWGSEVKGWPTKPVGFWSDLSDHRKWKTTTTGLDFENAPDTWYYRFNKLAHKEAFPGSSTIFVSITDGPHLMQFIYLLCFSGAIAIHYDRWFISLIIIRAVFGIVFSIAYKVLAK